MPRRVLPLCDGNFYHIFNRGVNRHEIFFEDSDYIHFIDTVRFYQLWKPELRLSKYLLLPENLQYKFRQGFLEKQVTIFSYVLMPNHFHFLIRQEKNAGISNFMSQLQNSYSRYFNTRHKRTGHLLQGQFKAVAITNEYEFLHVSRYIHLNPLTSKVVESFTELKNYPWSSLLEYHSPQKISLCDTETLLSSFKDRTSYMKFIRDNANYQRELHEIKKLILE